MKVRRCRGSKKRSAALLAAALALTPVAAAADPLRLRGDALVQTSPQSGTPAGLLVLSGEDRLRPWVDAESVMWLGVTNDPEATGDVLTLSVRVHDPNGLGEVRAGRMVITTGAIRPVHLDGLHGLLRLPWGTSVEAFGGFPVAPRFDYHGVEWAVGGRVAQTAGDWLVVGGSYMQQRNEEHPEYQEAGADLTLTPGEVFSATGHVAFDLIDPGLAEALASASVNAGPLRFEAFLTSRSPGRLLPKTSLFSVLGDIAATTTGGSVYWKAAPRLELVGTASAQVQDEIVGGQVALRGRLALDDRWNGSLGAELRRVYFDTARWVGVRATASLPLPWHFHVGAELELVRPDDPQGQGDLWPWGLASLGYRPAPGWEVAAAVEASAGPQTTREVDALARLSYAFGRPR